MFTLDSGEHSRTVPLVCSPRATGEPSRGGGGGSGGMQGAEVVAEWAENRGSRGKEEERNET